jgi:hypothetical protein
MNDEEMLLPDIHRPITPAGADRPARSGAAFVLPLPSARRRAVSLPPFVPSLAIKRKPVETPSD